MFEARGLSVPEPYPEVLHALATSDDRRHQAFLIDLAFYPTPYQDLALELLTGRAGPFDIEDSVRLVEDRGFLRPEDDLQDYLVFKQQLLKTIVHGVPDFLDPDAARTISAQEIFWGGVLVDGIPP
jgi:hypothetical protein